jgi:hypothetical protein
VVPRITLDDVDPPSWREIAVLDSTTLPELHRAIQIVFQWYDDHLHQFTIGEERFTIPDEELDDFGVPARSALGDTLAQVGLTLGAHFTHEHDFGDSWTHRIEVRAISSRPSVRRSRTSVGCMINTFASCPATTTDAMSPLTSHGARRRSAQARGQPCRHTSRGVPFLNRRPATNHMRTGLAKCVCKTSESASA